MMKAKYIYIASLAALMLTGCKDDEIINRPDVSGNEVQFGAALDPVTRTEYGDRVDNAYPIYWNHGSNLDKIFIFSPDGRPGFTQGYYEVQPEDAGQTAASTVVRTSETGVQWGSGETSDFYAFYPGNESFGLQVNGSTLTATLPGEQMVTFPANAFPSDPTTQDITITGKPDMNNCMMYAQTPNVPTGADNKISLQFKPLSSVLDITINGTDDETNFYVPEDPKLGRTWAEVTSIEVESANHQICGTFSYDFATNTYTANSTQAADKVIRVDTRVQKKDAAGNDVLEGITLYKNQRLNVKIFLLPTADLNDLTVTVHTADNRVWIKELKMTQWKTSQINPAILPKLNLKNKQFDYSVWMSQLDPNIKASELSLPGSCMSFVSDATSSLSDGQKVQTLDYEKQYDQGIRVFQCHAFLDNSQNGTDGRTGRIMIRVGNANTGIGFFDMIKKLCSFMTDNHSNEYCVVTVSDYIISSNSTEGSLDEFYTRLKELSLWPEITNLLADNVTSATTLGELAGKVILKIQLKGVSARDIQPVTFNTAKGYIDSWDFIDGAKVLLSQWVGGARNRVVYARSSFGSVGSGDYQHFRSNYDGYTDNATYIPSSNPDYYLKDCTGIKGAALKNILMNTVWSEASLISAYRPEYYTYNRQSGYFVGTSSLTTMPSEQTLASDFWYIFVEHDEASYMTSMVGQLCSAINNTYKGYNNKRYMNYVGGTGTSAANLTTVSNTLYENWWNAIVTSETINGSTLMGKPWGWVLFNLVGESMGRMINLEDNSIAASAGSTGTWVTPVQRVIMHNNDFIMTRGQTTSKAAPQGDSKLTPSAVSLF